MNNVAGVKVIQNSVTITIHTLKTISIQNLSKLKVMYFNPCFNSLQELTKNIYIVKPDD